LQAGPARLDIIRQQEVVAPEEMREFLAYALDLFDGYLRETEADAKRVACLVNRFGAYQNAAMAVAEHFCKPELLCDPLKRPSDFQLHAAKQFDFGKWLRVNSWFRCKSANLTIGKNAPVAGVLIEQDFNTPEPPPAELEPGVIRRFFEEAPAELQEVVDKYFPAKE